MATSANNARQTELSALVEITYLNIGAANPVTVPVPVGALVTVSAHIAVASDATTATLTVSDGTTTHVSAEDLKAAALTNVTVDVPRKFYPSGGTITVSSAITGTPTVGRAFVQVSYVTLNRQNENQF